ncbi:shikimate kinase [Arthrobacter sp. OVS8]|nr:shikimate kinase [Arthrobacter sp. OVS8]
MTGKRAALMTATEPTGMTGPRIVVMGVSGCGKTTIGDLVARGLGAPFLDGDSSTRWKTSPRWQPAPR